MVTRKPPGGLAGAPYLVENRISVEGLTSAAAASSGVRRATPLPPFRPMSTW
jgi:aspartate dehydrogenase